jgi:hypothetical protein
LKSYTSNDELFYKRRKFMMKKLPHLLNGRAFYRDVLLLCGVLVIGWLAWIARNDLALVFKNISPGYFLVAVLLGVAFTIVQSALFSQLMAKHGSKSGMADLMAAFLLSQPGKYIPGGIWPVVMQSLALRDSTSFTGIAIANVELVAIAITQMTALGLACLWFYSPFIVLTALICGLALSAGIILLPTAMLLNRISSRLATLLRIDPWEQSNHRKLFRIAVLLSGVTIGFNLGASLWVLFAAGSSITREEYAPILAALYLAFASSLLIIPVPAGVGIREAATVGVGFLVAPEIPSAVLISIALLARCWQLLVDAACLGLGTIMLAISNPMEKK